jgi:hypothetical protein
MHKRIYFSELNALPHKTFVSQGLGGFAQAKKSPLIGGLCLTWGG